MAYFTYKLQLLTVLSLFNYSHHLTHLLTSSFTTLLSVFTDLTYFYWIHLHLLTLLINFCLSSCLSFNTDVNDTEIRLFWPSMNVLYRYSANLKKKKAKMNASLSFFDKKKKQTQNSRHSINLYCYLAEKVIKNTAFLLQTSHSSILNEITSHHPPSKSQEVSKSSWQTVKVLALILLINQRNNFYL